MQCKSWVAWKSVLFAASVLIASDIAMSQETSLRRPPNTAAMQPEDFGPTSSYDPSLRLGGIINVAGSGFDPTFGIRSTDGLQSNAIGYNNRRAYATFSANAFTPSDQLNIYHQPLIQIKLRIIEIVREDNFNAKTILDYIRDQGTNTRINDHNINQNRRRTTSSTRFPIPPLVGRTAMEAAPPTEPKLRGIDLGPPGGGIINVTSNNLNIIGEFLATEFKADLVTCPQVVTLNGQRVHLLSGANVPFQLGQSVIQDSTVAVQDTFYKHVGTNLIVTPRIINWGPRGEGMGQRPITCQDIRDWNAVAGMMAFENLWFVDPPPATPVSTLPPNEKEIFQQYVGNSRLMTVEHQRMLLDSLNRHDRAGVIAMLTERQKIPGYRYSIDALFNPFDCERVGENGCPCNWKPSDCTLDIEVILRQSGQDETKIADLASNSVRESIETTEETVGAAISDVVQLRNGHGAVIAGLIGARDTQAVSKVPVLGDIPWIGAAFRSKSTNRQKTEIVIFIEAEILPSDAFERLPQASQDFELTKAYTNSDVLCNPLEFGMQRAGFGSYLPPRSKHEKIYWERLGRKVQKSCTDISDIVN